MPAGEGHRGLGTAPASQDLIETEGTRFEPGIYWTPFAYWSDDLDAFVEGTGMKYRYRDIVLKAPDGSLLPKVDGGLAIDPSHPGAKARTTYFLREFQRLGFEYLKLDFLSHGLFEDYLKARFSLALDVA